MKNLSFILLLLCAANTVFAQEGMDHMSPEERAWMKIETYSGSTEKKVELYKQFIKNYPKSSNVPAAKNAITEYQDIYSKAIYDKAFASDDPQILRMALLKFPNHRLALKAKTRLNIKDHKAWTATDKNDSISVKNYIENYPGGLHSKAAIAAIKNFDKNINVPIAMPVEERQDLQRMGVTALRTFITKNPSSPLISEAKAMLVKKERFYYNHAIAQKENFTEFKASVNKCKELFPGTPETKSLWAELTQQEIIYNANKNRPDYLAWEKLNRADPAEINNYRKQFPTSPYAKKINILTEKHEKVYAQKAITSKSLSDIDNYNKLFPDGKNRNTISKIEADLKKDAKYNEVKKLIEEGNKYKLTEFIKKNKSTPLKNTVASNIQKKSDLYYRLEITDTSIIVQLINFDKPSFTVIDPANELIINSSQLKSKGYVEISYENDASAAYLLITDSNGRERKIKLDRSIQASLAKMDEKIIELIIEGGIPPYIIEFYNTDALYVEKNYEGIKTDKENKYVIGRDSLKDLGGTYDLYVKNLDGQEVVLAGLYFESSSNRMVYFVLLSIGVIILISVVVKLYLKRSRQKTIFDEYE